MGLLELAACEGLFAVHLLQALPLQSLGALQCTCRGLRSAVRAAPEELWQAAAAEVFPADHPVLSRRRPVAAYLSHQQRASAAIGGCIEGPSLPACAAPSASQGWGPLVSQLLLQLQEHRGRLVLLVGHGKSLRHACTVQQPAAGLTGACHSCRAAGGGLAPADPAG